MLIIIAILPSNYPNIEIKGCLSLDHMILTGEIKIYKEIVSWFNAFVVAMCLVFIAIFLYKIQILHFHE